MMLFLDKDFTTESQRTQRRQKNKQNHFSNVSCRLCVLCDSVVNHLYSSAAAPPMISDSSVVIFDWRARLYCWVIDLMISSALSVAAFIATRRAICSLTAASRKHWNSWTL